MGILDMTMGCTHSPDTAQSAGTAPYPGSSSQLAFAGQHPFLAGQAFERDRAAGVQAVGGNADLRAQDRKSTRLNSSHVKSSYAVFRLKTKRESDEHIGRP